MLRFELFKCLCEKERSGDEELLSMMVRAAIEHVRLHRSRHVREHPRRGPRIERTVRKEDV